MADTTPSLSSASTSDLITSLLGSSTAKGAALGALMSNILGTISEPGGVVRPLDMSQYGIQPRTTTITPPRYVSYDQYGTRDAGAGMSPEQARQFGAISGLGSLVPQSSLSTTPAFFRDQVPQTFTSVGSGRQLAPTLSLTPRSDQQISPLTGALLGAAAGYLLPSGSSTSGSISGGTSRPGAITPSNAFGEITNRIIGGVKNLFTAPERSVSGTGAPPIEVGTYINDKGQNVSVYSDGTEYVGGSTLDLTDSSSYYGGGSYIPSYGSYGSDTNYSDVVSGSDLGSQGSFSFKDGGMATPMMADGGMAPSFYTYGTAVDPLQVMQQLAQQDNTETEFANGGYAHGGLHVPTVEGRHDYRAGSRVSGEGDGQSDDIPAMLADGEYVFDADTVAQLGNGSTKAGSDLLDKFREEIRSHKRSAPVDKIPPPSKSPLQYLKQAQSRSKKNG